MTDQPKQYKAAIVAVPSNDKDAVPGAFLATVVAASYDLLEDILEAFGSRDADETLGSPPGVGIWIWEGIIKVTPGSYEYPQEVDVDYRGSYRPISDDELTQLRQGTWAC